MEKKLWIKKKIGIKNCTCYYFDELIKIEDFDFDDILLDEKSFENIMIYDLPYKTLRIMFDKVVDGIKYLVLFGPEKYDFIFDRIRYLIGLKSSITYIAIHNYEKIKIDSDDDLPQVKTLSMQNVVILSQFLTKITTSNTINYFQKNDCIN